MEVEWMLFIRIFIDHLVQKSQIVFSIQFEIYFQLA